MDLAGSLQSFLKILSWKFRSHQMIINVPRIKQLETSWKNWFQVLK